MAKDQAKLSDLAIGYDQITALDADAFQDLINRLGITFIHYKAMRCPVGVIDLYDLRRPHPDHTGCSNGFLYTPAGEITCLFSSNRMQSRLEDMGLFNEASSILTVSPFYDHTDNPVTMYNFDRLFIKELHAKVVYNQLVEYSPTGIDRLQFPAVFVEELRDANNKQYFMGQDFKIDDLGNISWFTGKGPGIDLKAQRGIIYSIRYLYVPFWYIQSLLHEIRIVKGENFITGQTEAVRKPMQILIQREYVFHNSDNQDSRETTNTARQSYAPRSGGIFTPR